MTVDFIAEISSNHHQSLERCFRFIDAATNIGCYAIKFQLFRVHELFAPEILSKSETHRQRIKWELPVEFLPKLANYSHEKGLQFSCTPFYLDAVKELEPYVDFYKIASYELLWTDLLQACAKTGKPVVLSTGMATLEEVTAAVATLRHSGCDDLTLLHCISGYPAPPESCNLAAIQTLRHTFNCSIGWSDHSVSPAVISRAVNHWGAEVIEFHLDLDGEGEEFSSGHCWLPEHIQSVITALNTGISADGTGKKQPTSVELPDRDWRADPSDGLRPLLMMRKEWQP